VQDDALPLTGIRVLEVANNYAAPFAASLLCDYGADVVKIELPGAGDPARQWPPEKNGFSVGWLRVNRGKRSVALDLRNPTGRTTVKALASKADVVIVAYRPSTASRWGLAYEDLKTDNPGLIYVSVTGWGLTGLYSERPGFGSTADAVSGFSHIVGYPDSPPVLAHFGLTDMIAGTAAALGAAIALVRRERDGQGELVDAALYEPMMHLLGDIIIDYSVTGRVRTRRGNSSGITSPTNIYQAKDGRWLVISGSSQRAVASLFAAIGHPELIDNPLYATNARRLDRDAELVSMVQEWVGNRSRDDALTILTAADVVCGPVNTARDIVADPHFQERTLVEGRSRFIGDLVTTGRMVRLASLPAFAFRDGPGVGEHTEQVIVEWLGS
jgi:crotonobetainyl-CoA:carnitine CoA-transferase CaiB-like acyl-CoA transferase